MNTPFELERFSAVVVGDGTIACSLIEQLLAMPNLGHLQVLRRSARALPEDVRLSIAPLDITDPSTLEAAAGELPDGNLHLLINTVGLLHSATVMPEKRLSKVTAQQLHTYFSTNAILLPLLAQAYGRALRHKEAAQLISFSARVGSIDDNRMGGWYGYRASKAAHNMLLKTLAQEWRVSHKNVTVAALHPGTVRSQLSEPFVTERYPNRVLEGSECATATLQVMASLTPSQSGCFLDWKGETIPW